MIVEPATVRRVARLARLRVEEVDVEALGAELGAILGLFEQLRDVDVEGVEPMTAVNPMPLRRRADVVNEGGDASVILANAPAREDDYFAVPKVIE